MKIKNRDIILSRGDIESKRILLDVTDQTLQRLDSYHRIKSIMRRDGSLLKIGSRTWDLSTKRHIYLIGAGKACNAMAMAVEETLGEYLTEGIISVKILEKSDAYKHTRVYVGGHPTPNEEGLSASLEMLKLVEQASPDDLFIGVMSGGSSALLGCPVDGISLEDEILTTDVLLKSGAGIREINAVRRHISRTNGGRIAQSIQQKGAEMIGFAIRDSLSPPPTEDISIPVARYTATPIGCDDTTFEDARQTIKKYGLAGRLPKSVINYFQSCDVQDETPKDFPGFTYYILNTVPDSCLIARDIATKMGIRSMILSSFIEGEAREVGTVFASIAREVQLYGHPVEAPCLLISAGEATTRIGDDSVIKGHGGPAQEMTTAFAIAAQAIPGAALLSIDTEGTDGTTALAGGLTDSQTWKHAKDKGVDLFGALRSHATCEALTPLGCGVMTGNTGTNLCDFNIMYIPPLSR